MERIAPQGNVYQAGTLSGNPLAMAAGLAALKVLADPGRRIHEILEARAARLERGLAEAITRTGARACVNRVGSMITLFFTPGPVRNFEDAKQSDTGRFACFHQAMLEQGVYLPPSQFEAWFVSAAHGEADVDATIRAAGEALAVSL